MLSYKMEGIYKNNNEQLPFQDYPTILFMGQGDETFCWGCAMDLVAEDFIMIEDMFIHWSGDPLYCSRCHGTLLSEEDKE